MNQSLYSLGLKAYYLFNHLKCLANGLRFVPPNYAFFDNFSKNGLIIDVGVGADPNFTLSMLRKYCIESLIVDPTRKHMDKLRELERTNSRVHFLPVALGSIEETKVFYESQVNESGSLKKKHVNIQKDPVVEYDVQVVTLSSLLKRFENKSIDMMKIDIEGAEYDLIESLSKRELQNVKQMIIEFHHNIVGGYTIKDTDLAIKRVKKLGMEAKLYNGRDCLFYWKA